MHFPPYPSIQSHMSPESGACGVIVSAESS
jgi:hypothetical protein